MTIAQDARSTTGELIKAGLLAAVVAALGNILVLFVSQSIGGLSIEIPAQPGSTQLMPLSVPAVIGASAVPALGATLLLAILGRLTDRALRIFQIIGVLFLLVSFAPVLGVPAGTSVLIVLGLMHAFAGVAIIGILSRAYRA